MCSTPEDLQNLKQEILGVSSKQFQKYRNERRIAFSQFGRKIYVKRSDLDRFLEAHRIEARLNL